MNVKDRSIGPFLVGVAAMFALGGAVLLGGYALWTPAPDRAAARPDAVGQERQWDSCGEPGPAVRTAALDPAFEAAVRFVSSPVDDDGKEPAWTLTGSRIIGCCCATPCPCRLNHKPMHAHGCDYTTAVHIKEGELGGVSMDGMSWIFTGRTFAEDPQENWVYVYVSDTATDDQYAALQGMLGEATAALGDKAPYLAGEFVGMRRAPIRWSETAGGSEWTAEIPGVLEIKTRAMVNPGKSEPARSSGILDDYADEFIHAECLKHTYNDREIDYSWELTGRQANQARFTLTDLMVDRGGIGWGCWSAHRDLGDTDRSEYQERAIGHK